MTAAKDKPPDQFKVSFVVTSTGVLIAVPQRRMFRFLLSDGETLDVIAARDDSHLRAAVVEHAAQSIVGVAHMGLVPVCTGPNETQPTESETQ